MALFQRPVKDEESAPFWYITLSIPEQRPGSVTFALTGGGAGRDYKVLKIDASKGDGKSIISSCISSRAPVWPQAPRSRASSPN
mgnify:FL=1